MPRRVAFFTDTFDEINGVALTSRQFTAFARRRGLPFLCVRGGAATRQTGEDLELARGPLAFELDRGLRHDVSLWRFAGRVLEAVKQFRPDIIHVVSPGDVSEIGVYVAKKLKVPLAISWHTNLHEFGAMRLEKKLGWMPERTRKSVVDFSEAQILNMVLAFYRMGDVLFAPNEELVRMLKERTRKPVFLMKRGIDTELFSPAKRTVNDDVLRLGYVGRITPEKGVRFFAEMEKALPPCRFLIVGDGSEKEWLKANLKSADLPGIQRGEELAGSYADMDVFVFPSRTDTFGNVILEAFASGVPAVVTDGGGPKFIVSHGVSGYIAHSDSEFIEYTERLMNHASLRRSMGAAAREQAMKESWDSVFEKYMTDMQTVFLADPVAKEHDTGPGHPEQVARWDAAVRGLGETPFTESSRAADFDELALVHTPEYIRIAQRDVESGRTSLSTGDTDIGPASFKAAVHATGTCLNAVDLVMKKQARNAFCVVRPPGHHASADRGMGFCLFNNIAAAARYAQKHYGLERVLIADWDVHHGNGTQDIFYDDPSVFFFSTHQFPWYPGTGRAEETGDGTTLNCPLPAGSGREQILGAFRTKLVPLMDEFRPDLVLISAGFDSRLGDPLGHFRLTDPDFAELTNILLEVADKHAGGRLISVLEGGYNLDGLTQAVAAHTQALKGTV